jgi:hypothetical protein
MVLYYLLSTPGDGVADLSLAISLVKLKSYFGLFLSGVQGIFLPGVSLMSKGSSSELILIIFLVLFLRPISTADTLEISLILLDISLKSSEGTSIISALSSSPLSYVLYLGAGLFYGLSLSCGILVLT